MRVLSVDSTYYVNIADDMSVDAIKASLASRTVLEVGSVLLVSKGKNVVTNEDLFGCDKVFALCKPSNLTGNGNSVQIVLMGRKLVMWGEESILDLKRKAIELGLTSILETSRQKVIVKGKVVPENMLLADIAMFTGSARLSVSITSAGDKIKETFSKEILSNRLKKLPVRKNSCLTEQFRGLKRRRQRHNRLMPSFDDSPTKMIRTEGTPVKAR